MLNKERFCTILVGYLIILFKEVIKKTNCSMYSRTCFIVFQVQNNKNKKIKHPIYNKRMKIKGGFPINFDPNFDYRYIHFDPKFIFD